MAFIFAVLIFSVWNSQASADTTDSADIVEPKNSDVQIEYFDNSIGSLHDILDFVDNICDLYLPGLYQSTVVSCTTRGCVGEETNVLVNDLEILITPEYKLLFSKHIFDENRSASDVAEEKETFLGIDFTTLQENGKVDKDAALGLSECVAELGSLLSADTLGSGNLFLLDQELQHTAILAENDLIVSDNIPELEYARYSMTQPSYMNKGEAGIITFTVVPSLRMRNKPHEFPFSQNRLNAVDSIMNARDSIKNRLTERLENEELHLTEKQISSINEQVLALDNTVNINQLEEVLALHEIDLDYEYTAFDGAGALITTQLEYDSLTINIVGSGIGTINNITPSEQVLSPLKPTRWIWQIVPNQQGHLPVFFSLSSKSSNGNLFTFTVPTTIQIDWPIVDRLVAFLSNYWQWIIGTFMLPLFAYSWRRYKDKYTKSEKNKIWLPDNYKE